MIAKLFAFGVSPLSLNLMYSCLSIRPHRIKINKDFGDKTDIEFGVPQGFVLGPLLFNIDVIDLFNKSKNWNVASYADDKTPYSCAADVPSIALELQACAT